MANRSERKVVVLGSLPLHKVHSEEWERRSRVSAKKDASFLAAEHDCLLFGGLYFPQGFSPLMLSSLSNLRFCLFFAVDTEKGCRLEREEPSFVPKRERQRRDSHFRRADAI